MSKQDDTEQIDVTELLGLEDDEVDNAKKLLPSATTVKAVLVGTLLFVGAAIGKSDLSHVAWLDTAVGAYTVAAPLGLAWWIHRHKKATKAAVESVQSDDTPGKHAKT